MGLFGGLGNIAGTALNIGSLGLIGKGPASKALGFEARPVAELAYANEQADLIKELQRRMQPGQPSMADIATQQNVQQGLGATLGAINSARGTSPALRARLGAQASQDAQSEIARQGVLAKMQEENQNIANIANVIQGAQSAQMGREKMIADAQSAADNRKWQAIGGAGQALTGIATKSDENSKQNIKDSEGKARDFLEVIKPKVYEYKEESDGQGVHLGVIAQDLEKSELGKSMVKETPDGKMVDFGKGFGAVLAAMAEINQKLNELEKKKA